MKNIWEYDFGYAFFRPYIDWALKTSYSKIEIQGGGNVPNPSNASVLIAANHCNTLMDALVILHSRKEPIAYVARADIFKKPFFAHILHNLRILPIYRRRDCQDSIEKNVPIFDNVVECISHGMMMSIHPEGTHRCRHSLLPLKTGIVRIAEQAAQTYPERPVFIVPAGLEYDDYYNNMGTVSLTFGKPIRITGNEDIYELTDRLRDRISELITYFPDDEHLDEAEAAFEKSRIPQYKAIHWIWAVLLLPLFLLFGFLCSPMILVSAYFRNRLKDQAWMNTIRYVSKLFLTPFTTIGAAVAGFIHLPWYGAILLVLATLFAHPIFYRIRAFYKKLIKSSTKR